MGKFYGCQNPIKYIANIYNDCPITSSFTKEMLKGNTKFGL